MKEASRLQSIPAARPAAAPTARPAPQPEMNQQALTARLDAKLDEFREQAANPATQDRRTLIQNAMKIHSAKSEIFEDLSEEERRKLYAIAMTAFTDGSGE